MASRPCPKNKYNYYDNYANFINRVRTSGRAFIRQRTNARHNNEEFNGIQILSENDNDEARQHQNIDNMATDKDDIGGGGEVQHVSQRSVNSTTFSRSHATHASRRTISVPINNPSVVVRTSISTTIPNQRSKITKSMSTKSNVAVPSINTLASNVATLATMDKPAIKELTNAEQVQKLLVQIKESYKLPSTMNDCGTRKENKKSKNKGKKKKLAREKEQQEINAYQFTLVSNVLSNRVPTIEGPSMQPIVTSVPIDNKVTTEPSALSTKVKELSLSVSKDQYRLYQGLCKINGIDLPTKYELEQELKQRHAEVEKIKDFEKNYVWAYQQNNKWSIVGSEKLKNNPLYGWKPGMT